MNKENWRRFRDTLYMVSDRGRVVSMKQRYWRILKPGTDKDGYFRVDISHKGKVKHYHIHKLVALCFINNPNKKPCINHKDGNKKNNKVENLEWCTISENTQHAYNNGHLVGPRGSRNHFSKINEDDVILIRSMLQYATPKKVSYYLGISYTIVSDIKAGRTWAHV